MPKNVVCKKCKNLVNDWCEKVIDSPDPDMQRDCQYFCEKTNAERIRSMSDEELAEIIACPKWLFDRMDCFNDNRDCNHCALEWLKQPAE